MKKKFIYYSDLFLKTSYIKNKKSTYSTYQYIIHKHINPYFADYTVDKINIESVILFTDSLLSSGLNNKSIKDILVLLHEIFRLANIYIDIPYPKVIKKEIKTFSFKEQYLLEKELLDNITPIKLGIYLTLYTGIRVGELCALRINDIDINSRTLFIKKTLSRVVDSSSKKKTRVIIDSPKTIHSIREIPIPSFIISYIKDIHYQDNSYFLTNMNHYLEPRALSYHYRKILKKINVPYYNFHVLRHTFATRCINEGADPKTLSEILGHSSVRITLERYVHPNYKNKECLINKIKPLFH